MRDASAGVLPPDVIGDFNAGDPLSLIHWREYARLSAHVLHGEARKVRPKLLGLDSDLVEAVDARWAPER